MAALTSSSRRRVDTAPLAARITRKEGDGGEKLKACDTAPPDALILICHALALICKKHFEKLQRVSGASGITRPRIPKAAPACLHVWRHADWRAGSSFRCRKA